MAVRWLWRISIVPCGLLPAIMIATNRRELRRMPTRLWVSPAIASSMVTVPLVASSLWQERFLPLLGITLLVLRIEEVKVFIYRVFMLKYFEKALDGLTFISILDPEYRELLQL